MLNEKKTLALNSVQILYDDQKEMMSYVVEANFAKTSYGFSIEYLEPAFTGMENTTTLLQVYLEPNAKVILERKGESDFKQFFVKGENYSSTIKLPFGEMESEIKTKDIFIENRDNTIRIQIFYALKINGEHLSNNTLSLKLT